MLENVEQVYSKLTTFPFGFFLWLIVMPINKTVYHSYRTTHEVKLQSQQMSPLDFCFSI